MKKLVLYAISLLAFTSCTETLNDKAEALIEEDMKNTLVSPQSYDALETKTDSAFAPMDNPILYSLMLDIARENITMSDAESTIAELNENMLNAQDAMKMAMSKKRNGYKEDYKKFNQIYSTCKEQIENIEVIRDSINGIIGDKLEEIKKHISAGHEFIGYKSIHKYKAENISDAELQDSCFYLFDKDMKKVVLSLPLKQYRSLSETLKVIKEEFSTEFSDSVQ